MKKALSLILAACLGVSLLAGCGNSNLTAATQAPTADSSSAPVAKKVMTIGDTTFNSENNQCEGVTFLTWSQSAIRPHS